MGSWNRSLRDNRKGFEREDYVPLSERDDWDGKVEVLKNYKDHKWTGAQFESKKGKKR